MDADSFEQIFKDTSPPYLTRLGNWWRSTLWPRLKAFAKFLGEEAPTHKKK